jgi:hypothetical protein
MTDPTDSPRFVDFLPATLIPDRRMSDECLERAAEVALDSNRIRCERTERGDLRIYSPTPEVVWLMIQMLQRQFTAWINKMKIAGQIAIRRRLFIGERSMMCPDVAYFAPGPNNIPLNLVIGTALRICPGFVIEICPQLTELRWFKDRMLRWMASGIKVGLLIVPQEHRAYVYSPDSEPQVIDDGEVCGNGKLEGLVIKLSEIWSLDEHERAYKADETSLNV